jgi:four helix bundle protein
MESNELSERLFNFAVRTLKFLSKLPDKPEFRTIRYRLSKSSPSSGANYEEAQAGASKADFSNKIRISLREMSESNYWFRIIKATFIEYIDHPELACLIKESAGLNSRLLGSVLLKPENNSSSYLLLVSL